MWSTNKQAGWPFANEYKVATPLQSTTTTSETAFIQQDSPCLILKFCYQQIPRPGPTDNNPFIVVFISTTWAGTFPKFMRPLPLSNHRADDLTEAFRSIPASSTAPRVIGPNYQNATRFRGLDPRILKGDSKNANHVGQVEDDGRSREDGQRTV